MVSPLLANVVLNKLDWFLHGKGAHGKNDLERTERKREPNVRFVRYADDWCVFITRASKQYAEAIREDIGLVCPRCGCADLLEISTRQTMGRVVRHRQCRYCGRRVITSVPVMSANAQATRLTNNTTTLATEYAKQGKDWETELRQRAREVALCRELGLTPSGAASQPSIADTKKQQKKDENDAKPSKSPAA